MIAERLKKEQETNPPKGKNPYRTWIDNYIAEDYQAAVEKGCGKLRLNGSALPVVADRCARSSRGEPCGKAESESD